MKARFWCCAGALLIACGSGSDLISHKGVCGPYSQETSSLYIAPIEGGKTLDVTQANCGAYSHTAQYRYAYDFRMPIGTQIVASRAGTVYRLRESHSDNNGCPGANFLEVLHDDGTIAQYVHLTQNGVLVDVGDRVEQGEAIALSGNTGCSSGAHLHFIIWKSKSFLTSVPIGFSNIVNSTKVRLSDNTQYQTKAAE